MSAGAIPPFFVVGAPRTGTTLLRRFLSAHSRVAIPTESGFMVDYLDAAVPLETKKRLLTEEPEIEYWSLRLTPEELAPLPTIGACFDHAHRRYAEAQGKDLWGNKTPKLVRAGALLSEHFPGCRFLHVVRDGRAVASSLRRSEAHRLHLLYGARRYAADAARGLALERAYPERVMRVVYEELVVDPEPVLRRVSDFLGLSYEPAMAEGRKSLDLTPGEQRAGHHQNVGRAVDRAFVDKWRETLTRDEVALVEHVVGPVMRELGYEVPPARAPGRRALLRARLAHARWTVDKAVSELTDRPDVWRVARRRVALGTLTKMFRNHASGM